MCIHLPCDRKFHDLRYINVNNMCIHLPHNKNVHNLGYININNMCIHLPHNKKVHDLRYINVNNVYSSFMRQKGYNVNNSVFIFHTINVNKIYVYSFIFHTTKRFMT